MTDSKAFLSLKLFWSLFEHKCQLYFPFDRPARRALLLFFLVPMVDQCQFTALPHSPSASPPPKKITPPQSSPQSSPQPSPQPSPQSSSSTFLRSPHLSLPRDLSHKVLPDPLPLLLPRSYVTARPSTLSALITLTKSRSSSQTTPLVAPCLSIALNPQVLLTQGICARQLWKWHIQGALGWSIQRGSVISVSQSVVHPSRQIALHLLSDPLSIIALQATIESSCREGDDSSGQPRALEKLLHNLALETDLVIAHHQTTDPPMKTFYTRYGPFIVSKNETQSTFSCLIAWLDHEQIQLLNSQRYRWVQDVLKDLYALRLEDN